MKFVHLFSRHTCMHVLNEIEIHVHTSYSKHETFVFNRILISTYTTPHVQRLKFNFCCRACTSVCLLLRPACDIPASCSWVFAKGREEMWAWDPSDRQFPEVLASLKNVDWRYQQLLTSLLGAVIWVKMKTLSIQKYHCYSYKDQGSRNENSSC